MSNTVNVTADSQLDRVESVIQPIREKWLLCFSLILAGYGIFGKGFAYLGIPPVFIGEVALAFGLIRLVPASGWLRILTMRPLWCVFMLMTWGALCTLPYIPEHGMDALRDAVIWGYAIWAIVIGGLVVSLPQILVLLVNRYRLFAKVFLITVPVLWCIQYFLPDMRPIWPGSEIPVFHLKGGDVLVHVGGIVACFIANLGERVSRWWLIPLSLTVTLSAVLARSGLLSFLIAYTVVTLLVPRNRVSIPLIGIAIVGLGLLAASDLNIQMPAYKRTVSSGQLMGNLLSVFGIESKDDRGAQLEGTKDWRILWWSKIYYYTVHGKHFWTGKGFGINLADDDGFQVALDGSVRNPHSIHMTMLARAGVPGFALWGVTQGAWCICLFRAYLHSRRARKPAWQRLFAFELSYWCAFIVNASFDVYIEGPVGGIWFWTLIGFGLASVWVYRRGIPIGSLDQAASQ